MNIVIYLQEFSEEYHASKAASASVSENVVHSLITGSRPLMRSTSIQDELWTTF